MDDVNTRGKTSNEEDPSFAWQNKLLIGKGAPLPAIPAWVQEAWLGLRQNLADNSYPCFFGTQAFRANAIYYSYVEAGLANHLPDTLGHFLHACRDHPLANLAVFFEPVVGENFAEAYERFWSVLRVLRQNDSNANVEDDPDDPLWEFSYADVQLFVVGMSPVYRNRRSRNVGNSMVMLFQPRDVFEVGGKGITDAHRALIRTRLLAWDGQPHHSSLGTYGDPKNHEWKQYFLPDDSESNTGTCPFGLAQKEHRHESR